MMTPSKTSIVGAWSFNVLGWVGGYWDWFVQNPDQRGALIALLTIVSFVLAIGVSVRGLLRGRFRRQCRRRDQCCNSEDE